MTCARRAIILDCHTGKREQLVLASDRIDVKRQMVGRGRKGGVSYRFQNGHGQADHHRSIVREGPRTIHGGQRGVDVFGHVEAGGVHGHEQSVKVVVVGSQEIPERTRVWGGVHDDNMT